MDRPNLTVVTSALTTKVNLEGRRAVGIDYIHHGQVIQARAEREVILSGGAINSPHLLLLSGIGPADELSPFNIDSVQDLPGVGKNLQDHLGTWMRWEISEPVSLYGATPEVLAEMLRTFLDAGL